MKKVLYFFQISAQNIDCGYSLEPPRRGGSNEYPQSLLSRYKKNIPVALSASVWDDCQELSSRKHAYIILIPLNPTFIQ